MPCPVCRTHANRVRALSCAFHRVRRLSTDRLGVSRCFGEALGRYLAEQEILVVIALRIDAFQPLEAVRQESELLLKGVASAQGSVAVRGETYET